MVLAHFPTCYKLAGNLVILFASWVLLLISCHKKGSYCMAPWKELELMLMNVIYGNDSWFWMLRVTVSGIHFPFSLEWWYPRHGEQEALKFWLSFLLAGHIYFVLLVHSLIDARLCAAKLDQSLWLSYLTSAKLYVWGKLIFWKIFEFLILNLVTKPVHLVMKTFCFEIGVLLHRHVRCWQDQIVIKVCVQFCGVLPPCNSTLQYNPAVSLLGVRTQTLFSFYPAAWST
jgi:hypothetical protein